MFSRQHLHRTQVQVSKIVNRKSLRPYFAVPFGDMMIAGCFGLLAATAEVMPDLAEAIQGSLRGERGHGVAPWDISLYKRSQNESTSSHSHPGCAGS